MNIPYVNHVVFVILALNIAWTIKGYLSKKGPAIVVYGLVTFLMAITITLWLFPIEYANDGAVLLQFLIFVHSARLGNFIKRPRNNFYDLTFGETFYLIAYNLFFLPFYFLYVIASLPDKFSENIEPLGEIITLAAISGIFLINRKKSTGRFWRKKTTSATKKPK